MAHAQVEELFTELHFLRPDVFDGHIADLRRLHRASLFMNFVGTESLWEASLKASFATLSGTPSISYMILPGLITATQSSGPPLPLPMRVSAGFLGAGVLGGS